MGFHRLLTPLSLARSSSLRATISAISEASLCLRLRDLRKKRTRILYGELTARHSVQKERDPVESAQSSDGYGHELFFFLGTSVIPHVTPGMFFVSDVVHLPASYLEVRLDGEIRVYKEIFELQPYVLLGINLGYNTTDYYGWNNFQFGLLASWRINPFVSIFGGINYSVALTALQQIEQENEVWASGGLTLATEKSRIEL